MTRVKARALGISIGQLPTGQKNCITDVNGVKIGHVTVMHPIDNEGEYVCTGVTAVLPHGGNLFREKVIASSYVINGFGKSTGLVQLEELGLLESPIMLTNTFGVPAVTQGALGYMLDNNPEIGDTTGTINVVVGECNDSYLNSIRAFSVKPEHAREAIESASNAPAAEGVVGAGAGMICFGYKGGVGTSSRIITSDGPITSYTVGILVLSNFGKASEFQAQRYSIPSVQFSDAVDKLTDGSIMIILATDAPLSERQLKRLAKRCTVGLSRTGSHIHHGSGDIVIAFSTATKITHLSQSVVESRNQLREDSLLMNQLFTAATEATEEAILNSMTQAKTTIGRKGRVVPELSYDVFEGGAFNER